MFSAGGAWLRDIGQDAGMRFPSAVALIDGPALAVADQGNAVVRIFDLDGRALRTLGGRVSDTERDGRFVRIQGLATDGEGGLHVLDSYRALVQVLDPETGALLRSHGEWGTGEGELDLPLDIAITDGSVLLADAGRGRVEVIDE